MHTGDKPFLCNSYGHCFITRGQLELDKLNRHVGVRQCGTCEKSFAPGAGLRQHFKCHTASNRKTNWYGRVVVESIPELSTGEKEDNIHDVPGKGGELARHFGNAVEVDVDKGYLEEWNAPGLSKVLPQRGGPVRKERNVKLHRKRYYRNGKFTCDECGILAKREVMNEWHMQSAHVLGRIVCDCCGSPVRK